MKKFKAIIFDFDGVIHDTRHDLFKVHKKFFPQDNFKDWLIESTETPFFKFIEKKFTKEKLNEFHNLWIKICSDLRMEKKIKKILLELNKKYKLFIISSNSEKILNLYFKNNNFLEIFEKILGYETHTSKVEKFKIIFQKYNLNKKNSIFVTDTVGDILEANEIGIKTIAVDFGFQKREKLEKAKPYKIVSDFDKIKIEIENLE